MPKKVISIEPGMWWTKVALTECYRKTPQIYDLFYFRTPENAVEDGYIRDRESFVEALREQLAKRQISVRNIVFTINSTKVITREITIPMVKDKQLPSIVRLQAREHFPMDTAGYSITYQKMAGQAGENGKQGKGGKEGNNLKLLLIAVPESLLSNYYTFALEGRFTIEAFDYIGNSALSLVNSYFDEDAVVVQLEEQSTIISFIRDKKLVFQRVAPNGYGTTLGTVLDHPVLGVRDEYGAFDFLIANDMLYGKPETLDFPLSDVDDVENQARALEDAYEDVRDALNYHIRVVSTALDYYRNQAKEEFSGRLRLIGEGARIAGLRRMFAEELPLAVDNIDYRSLLRFGRGIEGKDVEVVGFLTLIGSTIRPLELQPREVREKETRKTTLKIAYGAFFASALISVTLVGTGMIRKYLASSTQDMLQQKIAELSYIQEVYNENEAARQLKETYESFDAQTWTDNERLGDLIAALEEQLPTTMTVQSLVASESSITMSVTCTEKMAAAQLLINLKEVPFIGNVTISSLSGNEDEAGSSQWQFSVTANYVEPPAEEVAEEE